MAWTSVKIHSESFSERAEPFLIIGAPLQFIRIGTGRRIYHCVSSSVVSVDAAYDASAGGRTVAQPGDAFSANRPNCLVETRDAKRITEGAHHFAVEVTFSDRVAAGLTLENLLGLPAKVDWSYDIVAEEYVQDFSFPPKPVRNAAGEPFDKGPEREACNRLYTVEKYVTSAHALVIDALVETNNNAAITIAGRVHDEDTLVMKHVSFQQAVSCLKATMSIGYKVRGWKDLVLDMGYSEIVSGQRKDITQKDTDGKEVPVTRPYPLHSDGTKMATPTSTPGLKTFYPYPPSGWGALQAFLL